MRYILNDSGYIEEISFTHGIVCNNKTCIEYTGSVPEGYESLAEWSDNANINAYKIVDENLVYDSTEDTRLQNLWASQQKTNVSGEYDSLPVGSILPFSSENLPTGYLLCDGSEVSRTAYEELFKIIGTSFGAGNGSTTFNLPNLKGRVPVGTDGTQDEFNMLGKLGGSKEMQRHNHSTTAEGHTAKIPGYVWESGDAFLIGAGGWKTDSPGYAGTGDSGNLQPYIVVNYIIKASGTAILNGNVVDSLEDNSTTNAPSQRAVKEINEYSLEETIIGIYFGKTLYRKCYKVNSFPNAYKSYFDAEVSNIEEVIHAGGFAKTENETIFIQGAYDNSHHDAIVYEPLTNQIRLRASSDRSGYSGYVWIEYTKTTD